MKTTDTILNSPSTPAQVVGVFRVTRATAMSIWRYRDPEKKEPWPKTGRGFLHRGARSSGSVREVGKPRRAYNEKQIRRPLDEAETFRWLRFTGCDVTLTTTPKGVEPVVGAEPGTPANRMIALLRANGGRVTASRRATIEVLHDSSPGRHLTAEHITTRVRHQITDVAESTVYRILHDLEQLGLVTRVQLGPGPSTYHLAKATHRVLVCQCCDATVEVPNREFSHFIRRLQDVYGFKVNTDDISVSGECQACRLRSK